MADETVSPFHAYVLILAVSVGAAFAILVSFEQVFIPSDEFSWIVAGVLLYLCFCFAVLLFVSTKAQRSSILVLAALGLAALAVLIEEWPATGRFLDAQSTNPYKMGQQFLVETAYQLLVPTFVGIGIQWQLMLRQWHKVRGDATRSLWPWFTTVAALVVAFNPLGIAIWKSAIAQSPTDWLRGLWVLMTEVAAAVLVLAGAIEFYIRRRKALRSAATGAANA